jgi:predicted nucleic acid-binding protein
MTFLDTTFLVAVVDKQDGLHPVAYAWAMKLARGPKLTTEYVLLECVNMFRSPSERPLATALIRLVKQMAELRIEWHPGTFSTRGCVSLTTVLTKNGP